MNWLNLFFYITDGDVNIAFQDSSASDTTEYASSAEQELESEDEGKSEPEDDGIPSFFEGSPDFYLILLTLTSGP